MAEILNRPHFSVAIDWKQRDIEQWLEQYGSWLLTDYRYESLDAKSVLGGLLDKAQGVAADHRRRALPKCKISDHEAEAVGDLLNHVFRVETPKAKQWLKVVVAYYVDGMSEETIADAFGMSRFGVTRDKMHGIIRLVSKQTCLTSRFID